MNAMDIYLTGVGGQGIGLISEILLRAADHAQLKVKAVDTHGLAQRGGVVVSHLRIGETVHAPLVREGKADLVVALEIHEALRGAQAFLKQGGTLVYYNVVWQPLDARLNIAREIKPEDISLFCEKNNIKAFKVFVENLDEPRMQNIALLNCISDQDLIPDVEKKHYKMAMSDLLSGQMLENNIALFESERISIN